MNKPIAAADRLTAAQEVIHPLREEIVKGEKDSSGAEVLRIYERTKKFVVYLARDAEEDGHGLLSLRYVLPDDYPEAHRLRARLIPVAREVACITDAVASMRPFWDGRRHRSLEQRCFELMARAMAFAFEDHAEEAQDMLVSAREEVADRRDSLNRMRYIGANSVSFTLILAVLGAVHVGLAPALDLHVDIGAAGPVRVTDVLFFGAIGAFFSVAADLRSVKVNHAIAATEMLYAGFVRVPIGLIAALLVVLLVGGGWALNALQPETLKWSIHLFAFLAGFSEMYVQNALKNAAADTTFGRTSAKGRGKGAGAGSEATPA